MRKAKDRELRTLIHDLRALSTTIYHSAENAKQACEATGYVYAQNRIETVLAGQGMLSLRIDMLSFSIDEFIGAASETVPVYRRVDKVVRCFRPTAKDRGINLSLQGPSIKKIWGPNNFELIPYAILDNALKYSPDNASIDVIVEDKSSSVSVTISSLGPFIEPSERSKIFMPGYRGAHAIKSKQTGTGIGLGTAKLLSAQFKGSISVEQESESVERGGFAYFLTRFAIEAPAIDEATPRARESAT